MRHKANLELERLYDKNNLKFERKTYQMMKLPTEDTKQDEKLKFRVEDLQDEEKVTDLISKVVCLTEDGLKQIEEQKKKERIVQQKMSLLNY